MNPRQDDVSLCKCKFGCKNKKCRCYKDNLMNNSRCHNGTSCNNKGLHISIIIIKPKFTECLDVTTLCNNDSKQCNGEDTDKRSGDLEV